MEGLELHMATEDDTLTVAMLALANTVEAPWPMVYFIVERDGTTGPCAEIPMPHPDVLHQLVETNDFTDMPWPNLDEPLHAVVLILHAVVVDPRPDHDVEMHVRICSAALANRGYSTAWQPAHDERYAIAVGETPDGWDAIAKEGYAEDLHNLYFKINKVIRDRKAALGG
jgi:hypothetical protein